MYGEEDIFRGDKIEIAPLEISTIAPDSDRLGHLHYRQDMVEFYSLNTIGTISHSELFAKARSFAQLNSESCSTPEARDCYILSKGNMVFIVGQAGIGKTTYTKVLVKKMLDPEIHLYKAEVVFFLRFREVNYEKETDLLQFLTSGSSFTKHYNEEQRKKILEKLDKCENLYIVMDGLDEAIISSNANFPTCDIDSQETAEVFIRNLLHGNILSRSKKIVTSRPRQLTSLTEDCKSNFVVNIKGLYDEGQEQICRNLCGDDAVRHNLIIGHINSRPDLKSYCHVPINCILIMLSFSEMNETEWKNIVSLTSILVTALDEWFLKKLKGNFQIQEISKLAYKGFVKNRYYFEEWDLKKAGVNFDNATTFLTNNFKFKLLNGCEIVSYFAHLMWQELFVAVKIRFYISKNDFENLISSSDLSSGKFEVVTRFLFGLCNKQTRRKLLGQADTAAISSTKDSKEIKKMLKDFAIKLLKKYFERTASSPGSEIEKDVGNTDFKFAADDVSTDNGNDVVAVFQYDDDCGSDKACGSDSVSSSDTKTVENDEILSDATDLQDSSYDGIEDNFDTTHDDVEDHNILTSHFKSTHGCDAMGYRSYVAHKSDFDNFSKNNIKVNVGNNLFNCGNDKDSDDDCYTYDNQEENDTDSDDHDENSNDICNDDSRSDSCDDVSDDSFCSNSFYSDEAEEENDADSADNDDSDDDNTIVICDDDDLYFSNILPILQWVFEMQDTEFTKRVATCLRNEIVFSKLQILPTEIPCFNYVLRERQTKLIVKLFQPSFVGNCEEYFMNELNITLQRNSYIQVGVCFFHNKIGYFFINIKFALL